MNEKNQGVRSGRAARSDENSGPGVFRQINGRPIMWAGRGFTHAVEGAAVHRSMRLLWTLCEIDVPADRAFLPGGTDKVDCRDCISKSEA